MDDTERQKHLQMVTRKLVLFTAGCMTILAIVFYVVFSHVTINRTFIALFVFAAGLVGGFVSIQQRLPKIALKELQVLSGSWLSITLIPINGGIFAIVLMLVFLSGILDGPMFPKFTHQAIHLDPCPIILAESFKNWLVTVFPSTGPDIAKLIFWSFVAGFSERFVPQIIRKAAGKADNQ